MAKPPTVITMADLAKRAGVSEATVSRALAESPLIAQKTRKRIQEIAAKSGYRVNPVASSLRSRITRTIAVLIPLQHEVRQAISDPFFMELLGYIADALTERGYSMLLAKIDGSSPDWVSESLRTRRADGVIVIGQSLHHAVLNEAADLGLKMVVWGQQLEDQRYVTVGSDNQSGGYLATSHLIDQGCHRIAFFGDTRVPEVSARREGYARALEQHGLTQTPRLEIAVHFGAEAAYQEAKSLLESGLQIDGIFAASDGIAMSAMRALAEHKLRVPADVAVVGFDGLPMAMFANPPLTTIRQDLATSGRLLVEKLLDSIADKPVASSMLPAELIGRASSARVVATPRKSKG
jgi:DNA-binding LacI/PurR family transcriptional regulator